MKLPDRTVRLKAIRKLLSREVCDFILISDTIDIEYLAGFHSSNACLLISKSKNLLFTDFRYGEAARNFCKTSPQWKYIEVPEKMYASLAAHIPPKSRIGIQSNIMTLDSADQLRKALKKPIFVHLSQSIPILLEPKLPHEIKALSRAAAIADTAFAKFLWNLTPKITEIAAAKMLEALMEEEGGQGISFETIVLFGKRTALPHGRPSSAKLKKGDFILVDFGCLVNGFHSDMTRTLVCGSATPKQRQIFHTVLAAQEAAKKVVRAGVSAGAIDKAARDLITERGFGEAFGHACGHGVGLRIHESPRLRDPNKNIIVENTVITVEPGIYISDFGGVRIEDMLQVTKQGFSSLSTTPRHLVELAL